MQLILPPVRIGSGPVEPAAVLMDMPVIAVPSAVAIAGSIPSAIGMYAPLGTTVFSASAP